MAMTKQSSSDNSVEFSTEQAGFSDSRYAADGCSFGGAGNWAMKIICWNLSAEGRWYFVFFRLVVNPGH
jgi:hypothetical protein